MLIKKRRRKGQKDLEGQGKKDDISYFIYALNNSTIYWWLQIILIKIPKLIEKEKLFLKLPPQSPNPST